MRWSKVRQLVEATFAEPIRHRVAVESTTYRRSSFGGAYGRGWITIDGIEVASFDDHVSARMFGARYDPGDLDPGGYYGRWFRQSCFEYLHTALIISLQSPNPLIRALALLNAKVGKTRLARLAAAEEHPLPKAFATFRVEAEAVTRASRGAAITTK